MPSSILKRPRAGAEERSRDRPSKKPRKFKKQLAYHSSSEDDDEDEQTDFKAVNLQDSDEEDISKPIARKQKFVAAEDEDGDEGAESQDGEADDDEADAASDITGASSEEDGEGDEDIDPADLSDEASTVLTENGTAKRKKRNDPTAFATSISKILGTKLTSTKRSDPVLSRSATATAVSKGLAESKLEQKARQKMRAERKEKLEKGRVRDVLGLESTEESTAGIMEREARLKKTAQRGVVKLFNAVREAQKRGEEARRGAQKEGIVGMGRREEKVSEMSKQGFLDLIAGGGKKTGAVAA